MGSSDYVSVDCNTRIVDVTVEDINDLHEIDKTTFLLTTRLELVSAVSGSLSASRRRSLEVVETNQNCVNISVSWRIV